MTDAAIQGAAKLDIGQVIEGTFKVLGRNIVTFGVLALILSGIPTAIVAYLQATNIESAANFELRPGYFQAIGFSGLAALIKAKKVRKIVCSFPRQADSWHFDAAYRAGELELELVPQGTLAERIRAAGAGVGA